MVVRPCGLIVQALVGAGGDIFAVDLVTAAAVRVCDTNVVCSQICDAVLQLLRDLMRSPYRPRLRVDLAVLPPRHLILYHQGVHLPLSRQIRKPSTFQV